MREVVLELEVAWPRRLLYTCFIVNFKWPHPSLLSQSGMQALCSNLMSTHFQLPVDSVGTRRTSPHRGLDVATGAHLFFKALLLSFALKLCFEAPSSPSPL